MTPVRRLILTNARLILPDRLLDGGSVVVEDGLIAAVEQRSHPSGGETIDLDGRILMPGIVDLHSDGLEKELAPRPGADFDPAFVLAHYDRKLAAAGITTQFHGIYFANQAGFGRSVEHGAMMVRAVHAFRTAPHRLIDHRVLHRLDVRTPGALDGLLAVLDEDDQRPILVSPNEHVPGKGQYWDLAALFRQIRFRLGANGTDEAADAEVQRRVQLASETDKLATETLARIASERIRRGLILASHDDDSPERVDLMAELGCRIAEFPITAAAAERARAVGMAVAVGAPNAVRGGSLTGNASALDLLGRGLATVLVADYHAPSLLAAVFVAADRGVATLPEAARWVAANPAEAVGLTDRGRIEVGQRADLIAVRRYDALALVELTMVEGRVRLAAGLVEPAPVAAGIGA